MKIKIYLKIIIAFMLIFAVSALTSSKTYDFYASGSFEENVFIPDEEGGLYKVVKYSDRFEVYRITENNSTLVLKNQTRADESLFSNGTLFLLSENPNFVHMIEISRSGIKTDIVEINITGKCSLASSAGIIYFVDSDKPKNIIWYDENKKTVENVSMRENVKCIITDSSGNNVLAFTDSGITDIKNNCSIKCDVPKPPLQSNGAYYTDSLGAKYSFNSSYGFNRILETGYDCICTTMNDVYALNDNEILKIDNTGNIKEVCKLNIKADKIYSSKNCLYAISDNQEFYVSNRDFIAYVEETESEYSAESSVFTESHTETSADERINNHTSSKTESNYENSYALQEEHTYEISYNEIYGISSAVYNIFDDVITDIPVGTTIAQLKKAINYDGYDISFINHNGKSVTGGQVGTGFRVDFTRNGETESYYTVITGDLTGEGNINTRDTGLLSKYIFKNAELTKYQLMAADLKDNNSVDSVDLCALYMIIE